MKLLSFIKGIIFKFRTKLHDLRRALNYYDYKLVNHSVIKIEFKIYKKPKSQVDRLMWAWKHPAPQDVRNHVYTILDEMKNRVEVTNDDHTEVTYPDPFAAAWLCHCSTRDARTPSKDESDIKN